jgi:hypothetical protein
MRHDFRMEAAGKYRTTPAGVVLSVAAGALVGATFVTLLYAWGMADAFGYSYVIEYGFRPSLTAFLFALVVWTLGLILLAVLPWRFLHSAGYRSWLSAAVLGASLTFIVEFALETRVFQLLPVPSEGTYNAGDAGGPTIIDYRLTPHGWLAAFHSSLIFALGGALVALTIWRVAYRRECRE